MHIQDSTAIVFGGASGLGEATVRRLAHEGARVVIADLAEERASALAQDVGGRAVHCDVTDPESVAEAVGAAPGLRISVSCAGVATPAKLLGRDGPTPLHAFARVIAVNLLGTINALQASAGAMALNDPDADGERGVCINTGSIAAYEGQVGQVAYAASKAGVVGLTLPVARELAGKGVRVVTIAPGLFETPMLSGLPRSARQALAGTVPFPARLGQPSEYAHLVSHVVTNTMLNGEVIRLDGALRMSPR